MLRFSNSQNSPKKLKADAAAELLRHIAGIGGAGASTGAGTDEDLEKITDQFEKLGQSSEVNSNLRAL